MTTPAPQGPPPGPGVGHPDPEVARTVYLVGRELSVSDKVMLAAFEAALVESGMENLNHGDQDSLGVFQQRPSQGWGTADQVTNVNYAAHQFFVRAKHTDTQNPRLTPGQLAQEVQRSAFPDRYDQRVTQAQKLLEDTKRAADNAPPQAPPPQVPAPPGPPEGVPAQVFLDAENFLFEEMIRNSQGPEVQRIKALWRNPAAWGLPDGNPHTVLANNTVASGVWDYHKKIQEKFPFESRFDVPGGEAEHPAFYDYYVIWNNIHHGFVGRAAEFNRIDLHFGIPITARHLQDRGLVPKDADDQMRGDKIARRTGADLWEQHGPRVTRDQLRQAVAVVVQEIDGLTPEQSESRFRWCRDFTYAEMMRNINDPAVGKLKSLLAPHEWYEVWRAADYPQALGLWAGKVGPHMVWDHKDYFRAVFGLEAGNDMYFKIPGQDAALFYDIWSNVHYGFVGREAGFDTETLSKGASIPVLAGDNDAVDEITFRAGATLHDRYGRGLRIEQLDEAVALAIQEIGQMNPRPRQIRQWRPNP